MEQYIVNLTGNLIGKHHFDDAKKILTDADAFLNHIQLELLLDDVKYMVPATLGEILCSFGIGEVMASHLGKEVGFAGDCEGMLRELVARALAYVIRDRLDETRPNQNVPSYVRGKKVVSGNCNRLETETAEAKFQTVGAKLCVVIPDPKSTSIDDFLKVCSGTVIPNDDEAGDDQFVVRIGSGSQEALERDKLEAKIGGRSQPE
jgi:hypothetical protein